MGLLDDAIREHLELKRRHGAAEDEVRRQEQEALGSPRRGEVPEPLAPAGEGAAREGADPAEPALGGTAREGADPVEPALGGAAREGADPAEPALAAPAVDDAAQVPEFEPGGPAPPEAEPPPPPGSVPAASVYDDEPWLEDPRPAPSAQEDEDEDVLEETPEFLQETPEHDRLWFEQKPPKDFDFDK